MNMKYLYSVIALWAIVVGMIITVTGVIEIIAYLIST